MSLHRQSRWLLVVAVLAAWWTAAAVGRPADPVDAGHDHSGEPVARDSAAGVLDIRGVNSDGALCVRLSAMTERELDNLEAGLANIGAPAGAATQPDDADSEMMMGDMPAADAQDQSSASAGATTQPDDADSEMMMGDMPAADAQDQSSASAVAQVTVRNDVLFADRESPDCSEDRYVNSSSPSKKRRIQSIQNQLMLYMGLSSPSSMANIHSPTQVNSNQPTTVKKMLDTVTNLMSNTGDVATRITDSVVEKVQSFFPICYVPKNTNDDENWNSKKAMNMMFSISLPRAPGGVSVNINMTKLRLYKHFIACTSQTSVENDDSQICQPISPKKTARPTNSSSAEAASSAEDKQIRVSVYIRLMKKKVTVKRKLLDSGMLSYYDEKWTEWNIHKAFKTWRNQTHNFTITVEVEDEDGNFLPVTRFFKPMNCTGSEHTTISKPIPGLMMETLHKGLQNGDGTVPMSPQMALSLNLPRYPIVDVTTVEVPAVEQAQDATRLFNQQTVSAVRTTSWRPDKPNDHSQYPRIRHENGSHNKGAPAAANSSDAKTLPPPQAMDFSRMGEDLRDRVVNKIMLVKVKATSTTEPPTGWTTPSAT